MKVQKFTERQPVKAETDILLVDTMGLLKASMLHPLHL